ncbi:TonB-dependent receptor plug domain-containing protein [Sinomicrobium weinanense]|uniref:TonB-dependent receptor n=1 Tax=Sinomicrobium weinanense TaxID=2842200 RepID=A0A926JQT8_9FLAO|nr:TonB-dependent receptor [Sinomicrobium weinanense]MBC9795614.1 TonB-dependent receptor [Sinomicrobium weinanense]MBU3124635.1 TonB-dependent receptor [Sinomicrobium weinanense]
MNAYLQRHKILLFFPGILAFYQAYSQAEVDTASAKVNELHEVIVTDQYKRGSVSGKLFTVSEITRKDIDQLAGNNLADILHYQLNIDIVPDARSGRSTVRMFGLDGEYVKILVDNIPLVSDNGYGNNIDITQINLDEVERIEVVEGAMGVLYGDNAVAGVINIVTKKGIEGKWEVTAALQEETVGGEYDWSDKGRHVQSLRIGHNIADGLYVSAGFNRNDFQGFFNDFRGKDYFKTQGNSVSNDGLRGYEWNPKEQLNLTGGLYYTAPRFNVYYKFGYYDETLDIYNHAVNARVEDNTYKITANDTQYRTSRFLHQFYADGKWNSMNYTLALSFQKQERDNEDYVYNVGEQRKQEVTQDITDQSSDLLFSRGMLSRIFPGSEFFDLTVGYELVNQKGYDVSASGHSTNIVENRLENYDVFAAADLNITDRFALYPGLRLNNNSSYNTHWIWGLTAGYKLSDDIDVKGVFGSAYKTPTFPQLFYYFVDANHDVQGNPDLKPEDGLSALVSIEKRSDLEKVRLRHALKGFHFNIKDKISLILVGDDAPGGSFRYMNIDRHRVLGASFENTLYYKNLRAGLGLSYIGIAQELGAEDDSKNDYLFNFTANASVSYTIPSIQTIFTTQFKYNGKQPQYVEQTNDTGETIFVKGEQDAFTWWDASIRKSFLNKTLELTAGARNLLDVVSVNTTAVAGTAHGAPPGTVLLGYGRSFYLKLLYNFKL